MIYLIRLICAVYWAIAYYPLLFLGLILSLIFIIGELIIYFRFLKDKNGHYNGFGILLLYCIIEDALPFSKYKEVIIKEFKVFKK